MGLLLSCQPCSWLALGGHSFRQADVESLYRALIRVLDRPAEARARSKLLRQKVIRRFDWSRVTDEYKALMRA